MDAVRAVNKLKSGLAALALAAKEQKDEDDDAWTLADLRIKPVPEGKRKLTIIRLQTHFLTRERFRTRREQARELFVRQGL